jgi:PAS domain S-box-containing protein
MSMPLSPLEDVFPGATTMSAMMRAKDWRATALGDPAAWPEGLKVPLRMMLTSRFEMWLGWGEDLHFFYNDAYVPTLGVKHPTALGEPMRIVWREVFAAVEDRIISVMRDGIATWDEALPLVLERSGYPEETYHTFSYSPLRGDSGTIEGLMCVVTEVTERVITDRRLETLRRLATALLNATTHGDILSGAEAALQSNAQDFPFAVVRLFEVNDDLADRATGAAATPQAARWPLDRLLAGAPSHRIRLADHLLDPPRGAWDVPPREALIVPITKTGNLLPSGGLILGLNPYRPHDEGIVGFAQLVAGQIAGVLASVDARLAEAAETDRLRDLFLQSPSFIATLRGPTHIFEMTNPRYQQMVGYRDVIGKPVREALPEIAGQGLFELLDRVFATGEPFVAQSMPVMLVRRPGAPPEACFLDFVYQPIRDAAGSVTGVFVEGIDVTYAHDAAVALLNSETQFRTFTQAIPNHLWTARPDGTLDWFNDQTITYTGRSSAELFQATWSDIVHPDDIGRAARAWARSIKRGTDFEEEFRIRRADGEFLWHLVRALPMRDSSGAIIRWIGTNTDIHARKLAEASNAAERDRIWSATNDLMGTANTKGYLLTVNPAWHRLLGHDERDLLSRPLFDIIVPDDHAKVAEAVAGLQRGVPVDDLECRLIHADGSKSIIAWSAEPYGNGFHMVGRNVTQQRLVEDALRQAHKMEAVGQLTGGIAHDFNNLLQGITGSLELVQKRIGQGRTAELDRFITGAMTAANRAASLTHRLLAFSRRQPLDPKPVQANPLVLSMEDLLRRTLGERIELELKLAGDLWLTLCDPNQLESALLNLAINARDAMPDGGRLVIETSNSWLRDIYIARQRDVRGGQYICIRVTDTGTGMTPETIERAFEPFFTTKPIGQGTGLGLSMIYGFARQSEGYAKIESEVGKGTTFRLYLPRHDGATEDDAATETGKPPEADAGETILVVEDEPVVRSLVVEQLMDLGYHVVEAVDGPTGLAELQSGRHLDLLVTDIGLPGLNGRQIADAGRTLRPGLKVLFMTGYAENAAQATGFLDPGMAMVTKPFAMNVFVTKVREMLEAR